jgi:hypothetical protein
MLLLDQVFQFSLQTAFYNGRCILLSKYKTVMDVLHETAIARHFSPNSNSLHSNKPAHLRIFVQILHRLNI